MYDKLKKYGGDVTPRKKGDKLSYVTECGEESKVQHQFAEMVDINNIVGRQEAYLNPNAQERFGDFSNMLDLAGNMQKAIDARNLFDSLPVDLRKEVGHSVEGLFDFMNRAATDEAVKEKCYQYGLFQRKAEEPIQKVEIYAPGATKQGKQKPLKVSLEESDT